MAVPVPVLVTATVIALYVIFGSFWLAISGKEH